MALGYPPSRLDIANLRTAAYFGYGDANLPEP